MDCGENQSPRKYCDMKPLSVDSFYGRKRNRTNVDESYSFRKHQKCNELPPLPKRLSNLMGPSRTWKVFSKQKDALNCAKLQGNGLMTFAFQQECGQRLFLVAHPVIFWHYDSNREMKCRCSYEVIPENVPCKIYFDLEFDRNLNKNLNYNRIVMTFMKVVANHLQFHFNLVVTKNQILILDSSKPEKFSHHLIYQGIYFVDNIHLGRFVKKICCNIRRAIEDESFINNQHHLWLNVTHSELTELLVINLKGKKLFCDEAVYTRNRHFRLFCSTKLGKNAPLKVAEINEYVPVMDIPSNEELFLDSLVTFTRNTPEKTIEFGTTVEEYTMRKESSMGKCLDSADSSLNNLNVLDEFVKGIISPQGWIWRRRVRKLQSGYQVLFDIQGYRYCANIGRQHRSNNIYIVVDGLRRTWYQKCHDPECRGFQSAETNLPPEVSFLVEDDDDLDLSKEDDSELWEQFLDSEISFDFGSFEDRSVNNSAKYETPSSSEKSDQRDSSVEGVDIPDFGVSDLELCEAAAHV